MHSWSKSVSAAGREQRGALNRASSNRARRVVWPARSARHRRSRLEFRLFGFLTGRVRVHDSEDYTRSQLGQQGSRRPLEGSIRADLPQVPPASSAFEYWFESAGGPTRRTSRKCLVVSLSRVSGWPRDGEI